MTKDENSKKFSQINTESPVHPSSFNRTLVVELKLWFPPFC